MSLLYKGMDKTLLESLIAEKLSARQIGERAGKSESSVRRALKKHGLKTFRHIDRNPNAKTKLCRYCDIEKKVEEFPLAATLKNVNYYRNKCNKCYVAMKSDRRAKLRGWFAEFKKTLSCQHCGNDDPRVIEFHHEGEKEHNVSEMLSHGFSKENILKEIEKCIPLCANCHKIFHYEEMHSFEWNKNGV